jgi:hypothetical protein
MLSVLSSALVTVQGIGGTGVVLGRGGPPRTGSGVPQPEFDAAPGDRVTLPPTSLALPA